jgi:hypothetical protein
MQQKLHVQPEDVEKALTKLGLTRAPLLDAVKAGWLARETCTANDPPFFAGIFHWARTVRVLRERLIPLGWTRSDEGNFCTVVEPAEQFAIAVASGCEKTGQATAEIPTTKRRRGPSTFDAVQTNAQLYLFSDFAPEVKMEATCATWVLLFYHDQKEIRAELSLPNSIGVDGHIDGWRERIILDAQPLDDETPRVPDFGPDPTIDVRRRK